MVLNEPRRLSSFDMTMYGIRELETQNPLQPYGEVNNLPPIYVCLEYGRDTVVFQSEVPHQPSTSRNYPSSSFQRSTQGSIDLEQPSTTGGRRRYVNRRNDHGQLDSLGRELGFSSTVRNMQYSEEHDSQPSSVGGRRSSRRGDLSSSSISHISTSSRSNTHQEVGGSSRAEGRRRLSSLRTTRQITEEPVEQPPITRDHQELSIRRNNPEQSPSPPSRSKWRNWSLRKQ